MGAWWCARPRRDPRTALIAGALLDRSRPRARRPALGRGREGMRQRLAFRHGRDPGLPTFRRGAGDAPRRRWRRSCGSRAGRANARGPEAARRTLIPGTCKRRLDDEAPARWTRRQQQLRIDYAARPAPESPAREESSFSFWPHNAPDSGDGVQVTLSLLSPGHRPVADHNGPAGLEGLLRGSARETSGRYPKHVWPEDPPQPSPRTGKPRGTSD